MIETVIFCLNAIFDAPFYRPRLEGAVSSVAYDTVAVPELEELEEYQLAPNQSLVPFSTG